MQIRGLSQLRQRAALLAHEEKRLTYTLPSTHSSARIQPRSSSFVIAKTWRSGVPHWRNWPRSCSRRSRIVLSSLIGEAIQEPRVVLSVGGICESARVSHLYG